MMARPQNRSHRRHRKLPRNNLREETNGICKENTTSHTHTHIQYKCRKRDILHRQQHDTQLSYTNTYDEHLFDFETSTPQLLKELGLITSFCKQPVPGVTCFGSRPWRISSPIPDCNLDQEVFLWNSTNLSIKSTNLISKAFDYTPSGCISVWITPTARQHPLT